MTNYRAIYEVFASTVADGEAELTGMTPEVMAQRIDEIAEPYVSVCHQCSDSVNDPQVGDLVAFIVDGVEYTEVDGKWVADS